VARCTGPSVYLVSWSPALGFSVRDVQRGPGPEAELEFESGRSSATVHVACVQGAPVQRVVSGDDTTSGNGGTNDPSGSGGPGDT
jgi:hypothetical protein